MPILTYAPEGAEPIEFDFDWHRTRGDVITAIEKETGLYLYGGSLETAVWSGPWTVRFATAKASIRLKFPGSKFECVPADLDIDLNLTDARSYVEQNSADPDEDDKAAIAELFERYGDAIYRKPGKGDDDSPKATTSE